MQYHRVCRLGEHFFLLLEDPKGNDHTHRTSTHFQQHTGHHSQPTRTLSAMHLQELITH